MQAYLICALLLTCVYAVHLRSDDRLATLGIDLMHEDIKVLKEGRPVLAQQGACVTVYSECDFKGDTTQACGDEPVTVSHEVRSARVPSGKAMRIHAGLISLNINNDIQCLTSPLLI